MEDGEQGNTDKAEAETQTVNQETSLSSNEGLLAREKDESTAHYLLRLQESGMYLFHGSPPYEIEELEPKQASDVSGDPETNDFAVYATDNVSYASQRAILPKKEEIKGDWEVRGGVNPDNPEEPLLQVTNNIEPGVGRVYVLPREGFKYIEGRQQWKNSNNVKPLGTIEVSSADYKELGGKIEIIQ